MENWITVESFGADVPENWEAIAEYLNAIIRERGIEDDHDAVNELWEAYWQGEFPDAPEARTIWYALMQDRDDTDWGTGTYDKQEAIEKVKAWRQGGYPDAYIAVIDESGNEPMCIDEITDLDVAGGSADE
jgi:hypothetical protein